MEDIYKIQVSVGLNDSIFGKLKELTASLRALSASMKAVGLSGVSAVMRVGKIGTVFSEAGLKAKTMNRHLFQDLKKIDRYERRVPC